MADGEEAAMGVRHTGMINARCPVNGEWDYYEVIAEQETRFVSVESFLASAIWSAAKIATVASILLGAILLIL